VGEGDKGAGMNSTILGVGAVLLLLTFMVLGAGGHASRFFEPTGIAIVMGGLLASALVSFRGNQIRAMMQALPRIFRDEPSIEPEINQLVKFAGEYVRKDLRSAEQTIAQTSSPFLKLGFQLVLDNTSLDDLMRILEWRIRQLRENESSTARCYRALAGYAPSFGMLGTLAGLIGMLTEINTADIGLISKGLALALTTTVYGLLFAYIIFRPISLKLEQRTNRRIFVLHVLMDGLVLVRVGRGPAMVEDNLRHLLMENRDEVRGVD
jgi:chemotaxis protein MotA